MAPRADEGRGRRRNASGSCEQALLPGDIRMGKPTQGNAWVRPTEYIGRSGTPRELKHLSTSRKREHSVSSGERKRRSPNRGCVIGRSRCSRGVVGPAGGSCEPRRELQIGSLVKAAWKGQPERVTAPYAKAIRLPAVSLSTTWKVSHVGNRADHRPRLNTLGDR